VSNAQVFRAANYARELEYEDFRVLIGIELGMRRFETVPLEQISFYARLDRSMTQFHLDKLHKMGILQRHSDRGYMGYQLIAESYDVLAFHTLVKKNLIIGVGDPVGRGKESDVYFVQQPDESVAILKIHRIGQNSFRQVRKFRSYVQDRRHISWLYINRLSAEKEYAALQRLVSLQLGTPRPIGQNRHMVIMSLVEGAELASITEMEHPMEIFNQLLTRIERIFIEAGMIHCDLSEYNILITNEENIIIIDWPQWEPAEHPNAHSYLERDIANVVRFFQQRFDIQFEIEQFIANLFERRKDYIKTHPESAISSETMTEIDSEDLDQIP
jgi:RIO kinase 2